MCLNRFQPIVYTCIYSSGRTTAFRPDSLNCGPMPVTCLCATEYTCITVLKINVIVGALISHYYSAGPLLALLYSLLDTSS